MYGIIYLLANGASRLLILLACKQIIP